MFYLKKNNLAWLKIPKNACSSWNYALTNDGWTTHNLFESEDDCSTLNWFGFLRNPITRHIMGLEQFLKQNNLYDVLNHPIHNKIIISALLDEHTYSIHHMIPKELINKVNWFVLDHAIFNYEILVKNFCFQHQILLPTIPFMNTSSSKSNLIKLHIADLQNKNQDIHNKVIKNYLERDLTLYANETTKQSKFDIYPPIFDQESYK